MAIIIDGKQIAADIRSQIAAESAALPRKPGLAVVLIGNDPASELYVRNKRKDCEACGFESREYLFDSSVTEDELISLIEQLNGDAEIDGILVQLPIPDSIHEKRVIEAIRPDKDVDGFHPFNVGSLFLGQDGMCPCTPTGILELLRVYGIEVDGKECVVVGRRNIVGKPMALMLLQRNATVTSCHTHTKNLKEITRRADVLISAAGCRNLISGDMVKDGVVVIDVAMNRDAETGKFTGDVVFDEVAPKASYITPVPGGVGPMTRAILMKNILTAAQNHLR